jgi:hypothetical protein
MMVFEYLELDCLPVVDMNHCYQAADQWVRIRVHSIPTVGGPQVAGAYLAKIPNYQQYYRRVMFANVEPTGDDDQVIGVFEWTAGNQYRAVSHGTGRAPARSFAGEPALTFRSPNCHILLILLGPALAFRYVQWWDEPEDRLLQIIRVRQFVVNLAVDLQALEGRASHTGWAQDIPNRHEAEELLVNHRRRYDWLLMMLSSDPTREFGWAPMDYLTLHVMIYGLHHRRGAKSGWDSGPTM